MKQIILLISLLFNIGVTMSDDNYLSNIQPTPEMITEAKNNPNGWVYAIDGNNGPNDSVPPQAIAGAWQVDSQGKIIEGSFKPNPNYLNNK